MIRMFAWIIFFQTNGPLIEALTMLKPVDGMAIQSTSELLEKTDKRDKYRVIIKAANGKTEELMTSNGKTNLLATDRRRYICKTRRTVPGSSTYQYLTFISTCMSTV